ncbi:MAG: iron donor protein CyaY [Polyangiales bacterium]
MDESTYQQRVADAFRRIEDAMEEVDTTDVDLTFAGDVLSLTLKSGVRCVVNTQRPTRQIWLAARANAWHFSFDASTSSWLDDKGRGDELFATIAKIIQAESGLVVAV